MRSRRRVLALVLALAAIAMTAALSWLLLRPDPTEEVGAVPTAPGCSSRRVPARVAA